MKLPRPPITPRLTAVKTTSQNNCCLIPLPGIGARNITNAPLFADTRQGNLHLRRNSPCINAGDNAYVATGTDLDGNPRIMGGAVDVGAYEYQGAPAGGTWRERH